MGARAALLDPANVQAGMGKVDLIPPKVDQLTHPETVVIGDEDHGAVAVPPAVLVGRLSASRPRSRSGVRGYEAPNLAAVSE
jgi:hypothetical protein